MAIAVLQTPASSISQELPTSGLLYVLGNKYRTEMLDAILHIGNTSNHSWDFSVETCAGRLGIHSEHQFAPVEVVNDDDFDKINLYKAVQENPRKLIWHCLALDVSEEVFTEIKKTKNCFKIYENWLWKGGKLLYLNQCSYRNTGNTFDSTMTNSKWHDNLRKIMPLYERIKDTEFTESDLFKIINKYNKDRNVLFIVDRRILMRMFTNGETSETRLNVVHPLAGKNIWNWRNYCARLKKNMETILYISAE